MPKLYTTLYLYTKIFGLLVVSAAVVLGEHPVSAVAPRLDMEAPPFQRVRLRIAKHISMNENISFP